MIEQNRIEYDRIMCCSIIHARWYDFLVSKIKVLLHRSSGELLMIDVLERDICIPRISSFIKKISW